MSAEPSNDVQSFEIVNTSDPDDPNVQKKENELEEKPSMLVEEHDDVFIFFLKKFYFPFLLKFHNFVCLGWLAIFIICIVYGPAFLSSTRSNLELPKNAPSTIAVDAFVKNYPEASSWPPIFIVAHSGSESVKNSFTQNLATSLHSFAATQSPIGSVTGYWEFIDVPGFQLLAEQAVSKDGHTMVSTVSFVKSATLKKIDDTVVKLLEFAHSHSTAAISVGCTGQFALFSEMSEATTKNFELIDATVLPIAIVILGIRVQSYRHMAIAFINLACALLLAFAVLVPVTKTVDINPFAPSIMMSLCIAISFDYSLFMLCRFREEMDEGKSTEDAVYSCLAQAGHVVCLSGTTLFVTFALLVGFPQNFLQSVGYGCGAAVLTAMFANMTITPALLLSCKCFSRFEMCPSSKSFCCYIAADADGPVDANKSSAPSCCELNVKISNTSSPAEANEGKEQGDGDGGEGVTTVVGRTSPSEEGKDRTNPLLAPIVNAMNTMWSKCLSVTPIKDCPRSLWFVLSYLSTEYYIAIMIITLGITAPFLWRFVTFTPTSDNDLIYLQGSSSLDTLHIMQENFPLGSLDPYAIISCTNVPNSILTPEYFSLENALIHKVLNSESPKYMNSDTVTALSFFAGHDISFETSMSYFNASSPAYYSSEAGGYRLLAGGAINAAQSCSMIQIQTVVNPNSQAIVGFINSVRKLLTSYASSTTYNGTPVNAYLFGGYTTTLDVQNILYKLVPLMIGLTVGIVLLLVTLAFGSIAVSLRLAFTIFVSLAWTYGFMVGALLCCLSHCISYNSQSSLATTFSSLAFLSFVPCCQVIVYQPGAGQRAFAKITPTLLTSSGIYWIIPLMSFSILVGLALDYDIFLMSRVVEYRRLGWSDRAAMCLAVEKTGGIITAAGVIMSISFAGLLLPKTTVLNQYGFSLFMGVAIDTFVVRTVLVPAVVCLLGHSETNWWPAKMPPVILTPEEEFKALMAGQWAPIEGYTQKLPPQETEEKGEGVGVGSDSHA